MAYKVIILYRLYMPPYFLGTFTEYPFIYVIRKYSGTPRNSYGIKRKLTQIFTDLRIETSCNQ